MRSSLVGAVTVAVGLVMTGACGSEKVVETGGGTTDPTTTPTTTPAPTEAPPTTTAGSDATTTLPDPPPTSRAESQLPRLTLKDVATGAEVDLASLAPATQPILAWFWAPH